jgi:hypothetical protein
MAALLVAAPLPRGSTIVTLFVVVAERDAYDIAHFASGNTSFAQFEDEPTGDDMRVQKRRVSTRIGWYPDFQAGFFAVI